VGCWQDNRKHKIRMSIAPNPSHLEAVNPVVMGLVRALQMRLGDSGGQQVAGLLIHGDAAFAALGIVAECLQLANTPGACLTLQHGCCTRPAWCYSVTTKASCRQLRDSEAARMKGFS
jgi:hypothetical protein